MNEKLLEACQLIKKRGYKAMPHVTIDETEKRCCPIGAYMLINCLSKEEAMNSLGVSEEDLKTFMFGFDGYIGDFGLGREFREMWKKGQI